MMDIETRAKQEGDKAREIQQRLADARKAEDAREHPDKAPADADVPEPKDEATEEEIPAAKKEEPETPAQPEVAPQDDANSETWKHKFLTLQGMLNADKRRAETRIKELETQVSTLVAKLADTSPAEPGKKPEPATGPKRIDPQTFAEYGEEFQALVRQVNETRDENELLKKQLGDQQKFLGDQIEPLKKTVAQSATERFLVELGKLCPSYASLNTDQVFLAWLSEVNVFDPAGRSRQECLNEACRDLKVGTAAAYFNEYLRNHGKGGQDAATPQAPKPASPQEHHPANIQPSSRPHQTVPAGKKVYTRDEVNAFYRDVARGVFAGKEADALAMKRDIALASHEGRIR